MIQDVHTIQSGSIPHNDTANRIATFNDIDAAIAFRRQFPQWEVHCLLVFPRCGEAEAAEPVVPAQPTSQAEQVPAEVIMGQGQMINLAHPLLDVPATADVLGLWWENGRVLGLELRFPDHHHAFLTFQEIEALQDEA